MNLRPHTSTVNSEFFQYLNLCSKTIVRSSRTVFCKKGVLRNFAKFTGKNLFQGLFFNKVAVWGLQLY